MILKTGAYSQKEHDIILSCLERGLDCGDVAEILRRDVLSVQNYCKSKNFHTQKDIKISETINDYWRQRGETQDVVQFYYGHTQSRLVNGLPS